MKARRPKKPAAAAGAAAKRGHCVSVRLNAVEYTQLQNTATAQRQKMGEALRESYFIGSPPPVPPGNLKNWNALVPPLLKLSELVFYLNQGDLPEDLRPVLTRLLEEIHALRAELIGKKP